MIDCSFGIVCFGFIAGVVGFIRSERAIDRSLRGPALPKATARQRELVAREGR
jgi:hypothetical protein